MELLPATAHGPNHTGFAHDRTHDKHCITNLYYNIAADFCMSKSEPSVLLYAQKTAATSSSYEYKNEKKNYAKVHD